MKRSTHPPYAPSLFESIRSIGYSLESAIADLLDNSITAGASKIHIRFSPYAQPYVGIIDDGNGMTSEIVERSNASWRSAEPWVEVVTNMIRGRFGLGLKTASLSQCRRLTVVSFKYGELSARSWDLDVIIDEKEWVLLELDYEEITALPLISDLLSQQSGTLVLWQDLDRITNGETTLKGHLGTRWIQRESIFHLCFIVTYRENQA